jgi:hypothetical protein
MAVHFRQESTLSFYYHPTVYHYLNYNGERNEVPRPSFDALKGQAYQVVSNGSSPASYGLY